MGAVQAIQQLWEIVFESVNILRIELVDGVNLNHYAAFAGGAVFSGDIGYSHDPDDVDKAAVLTQRKLEVDSITVFKAVVAQCDIDCQVAHSFCKGVRCNKVSVFH